MEKIFKCLKSDFETLQKKINHITKKLDKNNLKWTFEVISETIEEIEIIDYRNLDNIPTWQFVPKSLGKKPVEVVNYTFEMESLKLGKYEVIAVIEHNVTNDNNNIIHIVKENTSVPLKYRTIKSTCEHCKSDRQRNKTVLLQDQNGKYIQVGTSCIKEFTGIDGIDIIRYYADISNICLTEVFADYEKLGSYQKYDKTVNYLTACIQLIKECGYDKESTKYKAWEISNKDKQDAKYKELAITVMEYFKNNQFLDNFLNNTKIYLSNEYTKISGFVAYALLAYEKEMEKLQQKEIKKGNKNASQYIGTVGEKIQKELKLNKAIVYETHYTYYGETNYIYLFEDTEGNIYKWNTSKDLEKNEGDTITIKGTIKAHEEYNNQKQTVLTRCKEV